MHYQANAQNPIYTELLGIVKKTFGVVGVLQQAESSLVRKVNLSIYTMAQMQQKHAEGNVFLNRIISQDKLWLIGSDDDLEKLI